MEKKVKKTPIGQIGREERKITIADEFEVTTQYHIVSDISPRQLAESWLDPSEFDEAFNDKDIVMVANTPMRATKKQVEILKGNIKEEAFESGLIKFEVKKEFQWSKIKRKVLKKYNLSGLLFNSMADKVHSLAISSKQPLYDQDAHPNRVRNVLRSIKIHYPQILFEHEACLTSGSCPTGLQNALRKLAEETHGK
jgi:hypothetical protein